MGLCCGTRGLPAAPLTPGVGSGGPELSRECMVCGLRQIGEEGYSDQTLMRHPESGLLCHCVLGAWAVPRATQESCYPAVLQSCCPVVLLHTCPGHCGARGGQGLPVVCIGAMRRQCRTGWDPVISSHRRGFWVSCPPHRQRWVASASGWGPQSLPPSRAPSASLGRLQGSGDLHRTQYP